MKYWWCLRHETVEQEGQGCANRHRIGPFDTSEEAADALEKVAERNDDWENDPDWNDDDWGVEPGQA